MVQIVPATAGTPKRRGMIATLLRFAWWMVRVNPGRTALVVGLQVAQGLLPALTVWAARRVFDHAVTVFSGHAPAAGMLAWVALWGAATLVGNALWPLFDTASHAVIEEMEDATTAQLQRKAAALRLEAYERADFHDVLRRAREAADPGMMLNLIWDVTSLPRSIATLAAVSAVVGRWSPGLLVAVVIAALPQPVSEIVQSRARYFLQRKQTADERLRS